MTIEKEIGKKILELRVKYNMTQEDLAGQADLDRSYLSEIENGYKNISINTLKRIADALNVQMSEILGEI